MKKHLLLGAALLIACGSAFAQTDEVAKDVTTVAKDRKIVTDDNDEKPWHFDGMLSLTASSTSLVNWAAGGDQQIGMNLLGNLNANYHKGKHAWNNAILTTYGTQKLIDQNKDFRKTDDKMDFSSKYGYKFSDKWYASAIFNYNSQWAKGYNYFTDQYGEDYLVRSSSCWSPLYLTYTVGVDYQPNENMSFYISPLCGKTTVVLNDYLSSIGAFGVDTFAHSRNEFGWYVKLDWHYDFKCGIGLQTNATFFNNYKDGIFDEIDVDWNLILNMQISKYLALTITSELIYDEDIKIEKEEKGEVKQYNSKCQFKNVVGVGLTFKF